ncbi:MAG: cupin domain-containing protein [Marinibacterium sp.]|nr:cupin domain-containing protein [Marinibacterium sp.]
MRINADFSQRAAVHYRDSDWVASPSAGVERRMLDRIGDEVARATTIVRFAPGSSFAEHTHDGGEEFVVLEGTFQDQYGDFPKGTYVRNPPTTSHAPAAADGATILVKLHQFDADDRHQMAVEMGGVAPRPGADGVQVAPLYSDAREDVRLEHWDPGAQITLDLPGGIEIFVLDGGFAEGGARFERWDWLRLPPGAVLQARAGADGARLWVKAGHLSGPQGGPL